MKLEHISAKHNYQMKFWLKSGRCQILRNKVCSNLFRGSRFLRWMSPKTEKKIRQIQNFLFIRREIISRRIQNRNAFSIWRFTGFHYSFFEFGPRSSDSFSRLVTIKWPKPKKNQRKPLPNELPAVWVQAVVSAPSPIPSVLLNPNIPLTAPTVIFVDLFVYIFFDLFCLHFCDLFCYILLIYFVCIFFFILLTFLLVYFVDIFVGLFCLHFVDLFCWLVYFVTFCWFILLKICWHCWLFLFLLEVFFFFSPIWDI